MSTLLYLITLQHLGRVNLVCKVLNWHLSHSHGRTFKGICSTIQLSCIVNSMGAVQYTPLELYNWIDLTSMETTGYPPACAETNKH